MGPLLFSKPMDPNSNLVEPVFATPEQLLLVVRLGPELILSKIGELLEEKLEPVHRLWDFDHIANQPTPED